MTTIDEIRDNFELLEEWDDRYRYVIELGRMLEPMPEAEHSLENKVNGCVSQVWLSKKLERNGNGAVLKYLGDSDAHIVRGLISILLTLYSGRTPQEILAVQSDLVRDSLEDFVQSTRHIAEISSKMAEEAVRRMNGSSLAPR